MKEIMKKDGLRGFYFGLRVDILRVLPMNAITFIVYEKLSKHLCENYWSVNKEEYEKTKKK